MTRVMLKWELLLELTGGPGPDFFQCGPGIDKIIDFKPSEGDKKTNDCEKF